MIILVLSVALSKSLALPSTTQNSIKTPTKSNERIPIATSRTPRTTARTVPTPTSTSTPTIKETTITMQEKYAGRYIQGVPK